MAFTESIQTGLVTLRDSIQTGVNNLNVQNAKTYLNTLANRFIVRPKGTKGIGGFVFDYEGETNVTYQADITDHYLETNDAVQDHIAQRPVRITLRGFVAELSQMPQAGILGALAAVQNRLTRTNAYLGKYTPGAIASIQKGITQAQSTVNTIDQGVARAKNLVGFFRGGAPQLSRQAAKFAELSGMFISRQVFTIETPYTTFDGMVIETLTFIQPEETKYWSDISVTLKQMRFVDTMVVQSGVGNFGGRRAQQVQDPLSQGKTKGTPRDESILYSLFQK